jgi:hypothetical protein
MLAVRVVMLMRYVVVQEAPEFVKRACEIFVRLDRGGRLMLLGWGLLWGGSLWRSGVRRGSRASAQVERATARGETKLGSHGRVFRCRGAWLWRTTFGS